MHDDQPIIVPPMARIPQVSPQVAARKRSVYIAPVLHRLPTTPRQFSPSPMVPPALPLPPVSPLPQPYRPNRLVYIPPEIHRDAAQQQSPSYTYFLPQTPMPLPPYGEIDQLSPINDMMRNVSPYTSSMGIASPGAIPGSLPGYYSISKRRPDPGLGETLLGCASLLFLGVIVLVLLYYLAT